MSSDSGKESNAKVALEASLKLGDSSAAQGSRVPEVFVSGLSHHTSPIDTRERFSLTEEKVGLLLAELSNLDLVHEVVVASTCNRVEVIWTSRFGVRDFAEVESVPAGVAGVDEFEFTKGGYHLVGGDAVRHLYRVASGLDSLVVGENQILAQLKSAYEMSRKKGYTSQILNRVFTRSFNVAKDVRTRTRIGERSLSICSVARDLAEQIMGDLESSSVLLFGAGDS